MMLVTHDAIHSKFSEFAKFVVLYRDTPIKQVVFKFPNQFGASIINLPTTCAELALVQFESTKSRRYKLVYNDDFPDVIRLSSMKETQLLLLKIKALPDDYMTW